MTLLQHGDRGFCDEQAAADTAYLDGILPILIRLVRAALAEDPRLDYLAVVVQEEDGTSDVSIQPRRAWIAEVRETLRSQPNRPLEEIVDRASGPPSAPAARWVVLVRCKPGAESMRLRSVVVVDVARPTGSA